MNKERLRVDKVTFKYPHTHSPVLQEISFSVHEGEWISVIGQNGSGKSTLAKLLNGLLLPDTGSIIVGSTLLSEETIWEIRKEVGMVFQNPDNQFVGTTVKDDVAFALENNGIPREEMIRRIDHALRLVHMQEFENQEPHYLSGGQKQRVAIASVLALEPSILILDEATSMLDPKGRMEVLQTVRELVKQKNISVISITHDLEEAARADRVIVLNKGEIYKTGSPDEIFQDGKELREIGLDVPFAVKMTELLQSSNIPLKPHLTMEGLVNELWTSHFNK